MVLSKAKAKENNTLATTEYKKMMSRETERKANRAIRAVVPKKKSQSIKQVLAV